MIVILWLLACGDLYVAAASARADAQAGSALLGHFVLSLAALIVWWRGKHYPSLGPVIVFALGPCAMLFTMYGTLLVRNISPFPVRWRFGRPHIAAPTNLLLGPEQRSVGDAMVARLLDGRVRYPDPSMIGSLLSVMQHGKVDVRRTALETAVRSFDPRLSVVVAKALTDDDQTIRALAAAAASRVSQGLAEDRLALATATADNDFDSAAALRSVLVDHCLFDVLVSSAQRSQIGREVNAACAPLDTQSDTQWADEDTSYLYFAMHDSWERRDFEAIDRLSVRIARTDRSGPNSMKAAAQWWIAQEWR